MLYNVSGGWTWEKRRYLVRVGPSQFRHYIKYGVKHKVFGEMLEAITSMKILAVHEIYILNILSPILCDLCIVPKYVNIGPGSPEKTLDIILISEY
jgi:hypothetical protein